MGIVNLDDDAPAKPAEASVQITAPSYKGITNDTRYTPTNALLTFISGRPWTLNKFFAQKIDTDSQVKGQYVSRSGVYEAFRAIERLEVRVESPLQYSQDMEQKISAYVGSAHVFVGNGVVIPNKGDMFTADAGDGREALFEVTSSEKKSIFKEAAYLMEYKMVGYVEDDDRLKDLESKVVEEFVYIRDFNMHGQFPLLAKSEALNMDKLKQRYSETLDLYLRSFFSNERKTILMPGQGQAIYDPFLVNMIKACFGTHEHLLIQDIRRLNVDQDPNFKVVQLWEILLYMDLDKMPLCCDKMGLVSARQFSKDPMLESIYHSGVDKVVYPKNPEPLIDYELDLTSKPLLMEELISVPSRSGRLQDVMVKSELPGLPYSGTDVPLIKPVLVDEYYVLSEQFYTRDKGLSGLEVATLNAIQRNAPNYSLLLELCNASHGWGGLERFYYTPIVLILMKVALRSM